MTEVTGPPSAAQPLFIMAMDQRESFRLDAPVGAGRGGRLREEG